MPQKLRPKNIIIVHRVSETNITQNTRQ